MLAIPEVTSEVTDFEIGGNMSITSELLSDKPIRLFAQNSYTLTLDTAATTPVFSPEAAITIEGVGAAKITFDGNTVTATEI